MSHANNFRTKTAIKCEAIKSKVGGRINDAYLQVQIQTNTNKYMLYSVA